MQQEFDAKGFLQFQAHKDITYLYKRFLTELEDLRDQHLFMLEKLEKELPEQYHVLIRTSNFFDENAFAYYRKKILDAGNDTKRAITEQLSKFDIEIKKD